MEFLIMGQNSSLLFSRSVEIGILHNSSARVKDLLSYPQAMLPHIVYPLEQVWFHDFRHNSPIILPMPPPCPSAESLP